MSKLSRGFTLVELMVAITIVAIISTVGLVTYSQSQLLARDARRKSDLRAIAVALELYRQKNQRYPCVGTGAGLTSTSTNWIVDSTGCGNSSTVAFDSNYINAIPQDPILPNNFTDADGSTRGYLYNTPAVSSGAGSTCPTLPSGATGNAQYYTLRTRLENSSDPERCQVKQYARCDGVVFCSQASHNNFFVISSQ